MDKLITIIIYLVVFFCSNVVCFVFLCCFVHLDLQLKSTKMSCTLRFLIPVISIDKVLFFFSRKDIKFIGELTF